MKTRFISTILVLCLVLSLGASALAYDDTVGHWGESSINRWSDYGIVEGYDGGFNPDSSLTRGQLATIVCRLLGLTEKAENTFPDLDNDAWYTPYVLACVKAGILVGDGVGMKPDNMITRQESFVVIGRALGITPASGAALDKFTDGGKVADWAAGYMSAMIDMGIISGMGDGTVAPLSNINRVSTVAILDKSITTYINKPGEHKLTGSGITVINTEGAVSLTGEASGSILVAPGSSGATLNLKGVAAKAALRISANNVKITNAPAGTTVAADKDIIGTTVNGDAVSGGGSTVVEKPSGGGFVGPIVTNVSDIHTARLHDTTASGPIADDALISSYSVAATKSSANDYIDVKISGTDLRYHKNGKGTMGAWAGFAVLAPEGAAKAKTAFGAVRADLTLSETAVAVSDVATVDDTGKNGVAFYSNLASSAPKTWAMIQWYAEDGTTAVGAPLTYKIDLSGLTLKGVTTKEELTSALSDELDKIKISGDIGSTSEYGIYTVASPVTIEGGKVYGSFIVTAEAVTFDGVTIHNKYTEDNENASKNAINAYTDSLTVKNCFFNADTTAENYEPNGLLIFPKTAEGSYIVTGNTFTDYDKATTDSMYHSAGYFVAEDYPMVKKPFFDISDTTKSAVLANKPTEETTQSNTYTDCAYGYVRMSGFDWNATAVGQTVEYAIVCNEGALKNALEYAKYSAYTIGNNPQNNIVAKIILHNDITLKVPVELKSGTLLIIPEGVTLTLTKKLTWSDGALIEGPGAFIPSGAINEGIERKHKANGISIFSQEFWFNYNLSTTVTENENGLVSDFTFPTEGYGNKILLSLLADANTSKNVRITVTDLNFFEISGNTFTPLTDGSIKILAKDTDGNVWNILKSGWGPQEGFAAPTEKATTTCYVLAVKPGHYHGTINVVDMDNNEEVLVSFPMGIFVADFVPGLVP